jgi:hypothetical protein
MPNVYMPESVGREYKFRYVVFGSESDGARNHFRIEAVRRCRLCRALKNFTLFDDGTLYYTSENRAALETDRQSDKLPLE